MSVKAGIIFWTCDINRAIHSVKLHYKHSGTGEPVLILHGLFGMLDNWQTFSRYLSQKYSVYSIDLRNHGRSPHSDAFDYPTLGDDIIEFITTHNLGRIHLIGHSLGGKVAMQVALSHPDSIDHLMIVDMAPKAYASGHDEIIDALLSIQPAEMQSRKHIEEALMDKLRDPGIVLFLMKNIARREDGPLYWRMNLPVLVAQYQNITAAITSTTVFDGPTLFVRGGRSRYIQDSDWPEILKLFPHAQLRTVEQAGHWVHADQLDELIRITEEFLEK